MKHPNYNMAASSSCGGGSSVIYKTKETDSGIEDDISTENNVYTEIAKYVIYAIVTPDELTGFIWSSTANEKIGKEVLRLIKQMLQSNNNSFPTMLKKLSLNPVNACETFRGIVDEVLLTDETGVTWARVGILYAFATSMAKHCYQQAEPDFLNTFGNSVGKHIEHRIASWVEAQGGWSGLKVEKDRPIGDYVLAAVEVGAAVVAAVFTVVGLGSSSSAFTSLLSR